MKEAEGGSLNAAWMPISQGQAFTLWRGPRDTPPWKAVGFRSPGGVLGETLPLQIGDADRDPGHKPWGTRGSWLGILLVQLPRWICKGLSRPEALRAEAALSKGMSAKGMSVCLGCLTK